MTTLSKGEIESYVEHYRPIPVEEVGSFAWIQQMITIERINVWTHAHAGNNQFE
jgi:hypothetical protein